MELTLTELEVRAAERKLESLKSLLADLAPVVVAFSGGVDSGFLLAAAAASAGVRTTAVIGVSPSLARVDLEAARLMAHRLGVPLREAVTRELDDPRYVRNAPDRCYFCKRELFSRIKEATDDIGDRVIIEGTNATDETDDRPGMKACDEMGIRSPLRELRFEKREIRWLSQKLGLPSWDKPEAACLASRIAPGREVSQRALGQVEAAESVLRGIGIRECRVRHLGALARIETAPEEMRQIILHRDQVVARLGGLGYDYVTLDLAGYRKGGRARPYGKDSGQGGDQEPDP